jgi:hypothetical protein
MFLLQYPILAYLLSSTTVHSFAIVHEIGSNQNQTDVNGVRVHYPRTPIMLREEVRDSGLVKEDTAIVKRDQHTITANTSAQSATELECAKLCDITVFLELDDLNEALQVLNQGLAINEKVFGKEHLESCYCCVLQQYWCSDEGHGR